MKREIGVYVHIPFCKRKCYYCDFVSYPDKEDCMEEYVDAVLKEIQNSNLKQYKVKTVYIGGGTPSILNSKLIGKIMQELNKYTSQGAEITIEVNPGTVDEEKLKDYISFGINRLSIGLQSTNDKLLAEIGRIHSYKEFLNVYNLARNVGFKNINVDLMLGLPNQTLRILLDSLNKVIKLNPEHISIYSLILEEGTKLFQMCEAEKINLIDEDLERKMYWKTKKVLEEAGYVHYEISNFAKPRI